MRTTLHISTFVVVALLCASVAGAQRFVEDQSEWKTNTVRESGIDTTRLVMHTSFALEPVNDTLDLMYHEPYPDSVMPRAAIEVAEIIVQADNADDVVEIVEEQARKIGADWIIGFNEPRQKLVRMGSHVVATYRSTALLYKVIDPELVPKNDIAVVDCSANHINGSQAVLAWLEAEHVSK